MSEEESSVLFSLKELMTIEEDRIKTEEEDKQEANAAAEKARLDAEEQAREAEHARQHAEEERRRLEERRRREDAARLEALKAAELETARSSAEQQARMEAMAAQQAHERQLAALSQDKGKKRLRTMLIAGSVIVVLGGSLTGYFWYKSAEEDRIQLIAKQKEADRAAEQLAKQKREFEEQSRKINELQERLSSAADPAEIERLKRELKDETSKRDGLRGGGRRTPGKSTKTPTKTTCQPGDPLCSDL